MPLYRIFDLTLDSPLELPGFPIANGAPPDVDIRRVSLEMPEHALASPRRLVAATPQAIAIRWDDVGTFHIAKGREILFDPDPHGSDELLASFFAGAALALLLQQRGRLVLHASAVAIGGHAAAFIGAKGWGKSTLVAALSQLDCDLICDDLTLIDESGVRPAVLPGIPRLKLWPDSMRAIELDPDDHPRLHAGVNKRVLDFPAPASAPLPLRWIVCLEAGDQIAFQPLDRVLALGGLLPHWYAARYGKPVVEALGLARHLDECARLTRAARCFRLRRPAGLASLRATAEVLHRELLADLDSETTADA